MHIGWNRDMSRVLRLGSNRLRMTSAGVASARVPDALGVCRYPDGLVICESSPFFMSAFVKACVSGSCAPHDVTIAHGARGNRDGNPGESVDSLTGKNRSRRLRIHV